MYATVRVRALEPNDRCVHGDAPRIGEEGIVVDVIEHEGELYYTVERACAEREWVADFEAQEIEVVLSPETFAESVSETPARPREKPESPTRRRKRSRKKRVGPTHSEVHAEARRRSPTVAVIVSALTGAPLAATTTLLVAPGADWRVAAALGASVSLVSGLAAGTLVEACVVTMLVWIPTILALVVPAPTWVLAIALPIVTGITVGQIGIASWNALEPRS